MNNLKGVITQRAEYLRKKKPKPKGYLPVAGVGLSMVARRRDRKQLRIVRPNRPEDVDWVQHPIPSINQHPISTQSAYNL